MMMHRLALQFVRPGMVLARDVYDQDGTIMVSAGAVLTERLILLLRNWDILSVFVSNPRIDLPPVAPALQDQTRQKARRMVDQAFGKIRRAERFALSPEEQQIIRSIVEDATQDPRALIHLCHLDRNSHDVLAHSVNISLLATATALTIDPARPDGLQELALAALLHDIGLLMIPHDLISRRRHLSAEEAAIYREHTNWGQAILLQAENLPDSCIHVAQEHHENIDGTGYPLQLTESSLHPFSLIVSAVNAYENLCAEAVGDAGGQAHLAYESILAGAGTRFSLKVAKALLSKIPPYYPGSLVELTNGLVGLVVAASASTPLRPLLRIVAAPGSGPVEVPYEMDLAALENQTLFITKILEDSQTAELLREPGS